MRKFQKKMAFEFVQTLHQAHDQIKLLIEKKQNIQVMDLLEQCQEGAIELGNFIEQFEGEELPIIQRLEEYCENTYQLHEKIGSGEELNSGKVYKILRKQMIQIENGIKNEIKEQMEVVFLPYKASMWDSLESVWIAAKEDPNCQAYVIPIPYYDKDSEGNLKKEHWEGDQYPEYVPIFRYEDYDFEQHHPDVIFIHNPYDNCNYVTSVHPNFYSENLKKFTDKLVYIPYFILDEISPNDQEAIERMEHFCTVPAVVNADKVIVQSEEMRQVYIKVMSKVAGELSRSYWEKKILGLGSPKVDKILNTRKEDLEIPEEWMKIIQKPDGSWKKIIFYNTGINGLLENGEQMLKKIKDVFNTFENNREEVALLWRPHPLIQATIASMRPNLLQEYKQLIEDYQKEKWGIYDDTADMDRAVILSDGYYGDGSSIVQLCKKIKKPIMIQNLKMLDLGIIPCIMCVCYNEIFFINIYTNGIFRANLKNREVELLTQYPLKENKDKIAMWESIIKIDKNIVLGPNSKVNMIAVYNLENNKFNFISINRHRVKELYCNIIFQYKNRLFAISSLLAYPMLMEIDLDRNEVIEYIDIPIKADKKERYYDSIADFSYVIGRDFVLEEESIYLPIATEPIVIEYNFETRQFSKYKIEGMESGVITLCYNAGLFWMSDRFGHVTTWNKKINYIERIDGQVITDNQSAIIKDKRTKDIIGFSESHYCYKCSFSMGDKVYFVPGRAKHIISIDVFSKKADKCPFDIEYSKMDIGTKSNIVGTAFTANNASMFSTANKEFIFIEKTEKGNCFNILKLNSDEIRNIDVLFEKAYLDKCIIGEGLSLDSQFNIWLNWIISKK